MATTFIYYTQPNRPVLVRLHPDQPIVDGTTVARCYDEAIPEGLELTVNLEALTAISPEQFHEIQDRWETDCWQ